MAYVWLGLVMLAAMCPVLAMRNRTADWMLMDELSFRISGRSINFPCETTRDIYTETKKYIPKNIIATRMQIYKYTVIVAQPRYKSGVPITLASANLRCSGRHTTLEAFPDWQIQQEGNCAAIQSVVDIFLDGNNVLWVLDAGIVNVLEQPSTKCPPKVVAISMVTNRVLNTIDLSEYITEYSNLQYIVVENDSCNDFVYISDAVGHALIVLNASKRQGSRLVLPDSVTKNCPSNNALYLAALRRGDYRNHLYFTYLDCPKVFSVDTASLREIGEGKCQGDIHVVGKKPTGSKIIFCGSDGFNKLFFRISGNDDIYSWDASTPMVEKNWQLVLEASPGRQPTHVAPGPWGLLWVLQTNMHDFLTDSTGCFGASTILHPLCRDVI